MYDDVIVNYGITTFDNIGKSLLTEFQILTNDNWAAILYNIMDSDIPWIAAIYISFLVIFGSFFLVNIILAVIMDSFIKVQHEDMELQLRKDQERLALAYKQMKAKKLEITMEMLDDENGGKDGISIVLKKPDINSSSMKLFENSLNESSILEESTTR